MFKLFRKKTRSSDHGSPRQEAVSGTLSNAGDGFPPQTLEERIVAALRTVYDPEIPVNVFDLGLIYRLELAGAGRVNILMTLTAPACPVAGTLPKEVEKAVSRVVGVESSTVELVWDPPWSADRMSEEARLELGLI